MSQRPSFTNIVEKKKLHIKECSPHYRKSTEAGDTFQQVKNRNCMVFGWCPSWEGMAEDALYKVHVLPGENNAGCRVLLPHIYWGIHTQGKAIHFNWSSDKLKRLLNDSLVWTRLMMYIACLNHALPFLFCCLTF